MNEMILTSPADTLYICNRKKCETCNSDCSCTTDIRYASVLELGEKSVLFEDCPVGLFEYVDKGVCMKTDAGVAINIKTGLVEHIHDAEMVWPIKPL